MSPKWRAIDHAGGTHPRSAEHPLLQPPGRGRSAAVNRPAKARLRALPATEHPSRRAPRPGIGRGAARGFSHPQPRRFAFAGLHALRSGTAGPQPGRVPPIANHLRPAAARLAAPGRCRTNRGAGEHGQCAHHARRRRIPHQRQRADRDRAVAARPRHRIQRDAMAASPCTAAGSFPSAGPGWRFTSPAATRCKLISVTASSCPR